MGSRRAGAGLKVQRGGSPGELAGVRKRIGVQPPGLRNDADALLCLAAATQHAESYKDDGAPHEHEQDPVRQESVSSDNDYSEEQYAPQQRNQPRLGGHENESEEEKKEKRRLANREAARRMRRRRATHMAAIEEEVERLTQENSLLLHRMTQLVASHQAVDQENAHLRQELMSLRASVGACLQAGQLDLAGASLTPNAHVSPTLLAPVPKLGVPSVAAGEGPLPEAQPAVTTSRRMLIDALQRTGVPSNSGGQSTENEMTATEEERLGRAAAQGLGSRGDLSFASSGEGGPTSSMGRTQRKKGTAGWKQAGSWLATP